MDANKEILRVTERYNQRLEELVPGNIPAVSHLMIKRRDGAPLLRRAGRLGMAWMLLIAIFAYLSLVAVRSLGKENTSVPAPVLNAALFTADHPGSLVTAFREVTK